MKKVLLGAAASTLVIAMTPTHAQQTTKDQLIGSWKM
jgi:hypothetical protein